MRILSLSTQNEPCGIGDVNAALQIAMQEQGHVYDVHRVTAEMRAAVSLAPYEAYLKAVETYDATLIQHEFGFFGPTHRRSMRNFSALISKIEAIGKPMLTVLHTNIPQKPANRPLRWGSESQKTRRAIKSFIRAMNRLALARFVVHGEASRAAMIRNGLDPGRIIRIHLPMRDPRPLPLAGRGPDDRVTLGIFGFIADYKGYRNALEAMLFLPERFHLRIVGSRHPKNVNDLTLNRILGMVHTGRWTDRPLEAPADTRLRERVTLTGFVPDVAAALADVDIVLAPYTEHHPAGSAALSTSLSHGKPVIASATSSFVEVGNDGDCLKLVALNAPFELAKAIEDLATDHGEMSRLSAAALDFSRRNSWDSCARTFVEALQAGPHAGPRPSWFGLRRSLSL